MSVIPSLTILTEEQKFNGENLLQWNANITQLLGAKGLLGYVDGSIQKPQTVTGSTPETIPLPTTPEATPTPTAATPIYSSNPTLDQWVFRDQLTRGHIT